MCIGSRKFTLEHPPPLQVQVLLGHCVQHRRPRLHPQRHRERRPQGQQPLLRHALHEALRHRRGPQTGVRTGKGKMEEWLKSGWVISHWAYMHQANQHSMGTAESNKHLHQIPDVRSMVLSNYIDFKREKTSYPVPSSNSLSNYLSDHSEIQTLLITGMTSSY